jgi:hypothetical protein
VVLTLGWNCREGKWYEILRKMEDIMGIFGWSYPPGCNSVPGDEPDPPCEICGGDIEVEPEDGGCICPECPVCGSYGDPRCYIEHGSRRTEEQKFSLVCNERKWEYDNWCIEESYYYQYVDSITLDGPLRR